MEILNVHLNNLRNEEHYKFQLDFSGLANQYNAATLGIEPLFLAYQKSLGVETTTLDVVHGSAFTDELNKADALRDATFSGLAGSIKSAVNHFKPEIKAAAVRLQKLFDSYGNISLKPNDQKTAAIIKLTNDLQGDYSTDAKTMGVSDWIEELNRQNEAYNTLKNSRYAENTLKPQENLRQARAETDAAYRAIVKRINALIEVNGETVYRGFVTDLNERIGNYNNLLSQRQGRNAKEDSDTTTEIAQTNK